jgi:ubiquitin C-terminal hydrolase
MNNSTKYTNRGLTGLVNLGNSCYMNSAVQCLSNTVELTDYFLENKYKDDLRENKKTGNEDEMKAKLMLLREWERLLHGIWDSNCTVSPVSFHHTIQIYSLKFGLCNFVDFRQNDIHEFLNLLIDSMHEILSREVTITISGNVVNELDKLALDAMKSWKVYFKNNYSFIIQLFYGQFISTLKTIDDKVLSHNYDPFSIISMEIPSSENLNIYDCLDHFVKPEILDGDNKYYDEDTKEYVIATKKIQIWNPPKILIIHIKRFQFIVSSSKKNDFISYPLDNLNLSKYCVGYEKYNSKYNLYGISCHTGTSNGGHYYAYCKNLNNNWYKYNDSSVKLVSNKNDVITRDAYCLFYRRIN